MNGGDVSLRARNPRGEGAEDNALHLHGVAEFGQLGQLNLLLVHEGSDLGHDLRQAVADVPCRAKGRKKKQTKQ